MPDETNALQQLRRVQARMEAIARADGEELTPEDLTNICCAMMSLGYGGDGGPMRLGATPDQMLERDDLLAWVADTFAEEIAQLDEVTTAMRQRLVAEGLDEDAVDAELEQACEAFMEGTENPNQLPLLP
jgi:hypothetical protein